MKYQITKADLDLKANTSGKYQVVTVSINEAGTNYQVNELLTLAGGTGCIIKVTGEDNETGAITSIELLNPGYGYTVGPKAIASGSEFGSNATINVDTIKLVPYVSTIGNVDDVYLNKIIATTNFTLETPLGGTFILDTPVYKTVKISDASLLLAGVSNPSLVDYQPTGSGLVTKLYEFAKTNVAYFTTTVPADYKAGGDIMFKINWTPGARGETEIDAYVGWKVIYSRANIDGTFTAIETSDLMDVCSGTIDKNHQTPAGYLSNSNTITPGCVIIGQITRTETFEDDTWTSSTTGELPLFLSLEISYAADKL